MRLADFGESMRMYRAEHKMTQEDLADALGVQTKYISMLECGHRNPSTNLQKKMENLIAQDEVERAFRKEKTELTKEQIEVQLRLFHKLNKIHPNQKEKAIDLVCQILDVMAGK